MKSKTGAISGSTKWTLVQTKNLKKKKKSLNLYGCVGNFWWWLDLKFLNQKLWELLFDVFTLLLKVKALWPFMWLFLITLSKVQKISMILGRSENSFSLLQWLSMEKQILKHKKMKKTYIPKTILHNYILYKGDLTYIGTFPVNSWMPLIFTDFQHSTWCRPISCWKINLRINLHWN